MRNDVSPAAEPGTARLARHTVYGRSGSTAVIAESADEEILIAHARGYCHNSTVCLLCIAQADTQRWRMHHRTEELRRIDTEINNAHLSREVMRLTDTLDSIIEG